MRRGALRSALSERVREGNVVVIQGWSFEKPKTKDLVASMTTLGLEGKTLIVDSFDNENLMLSARNLQHAKVINSHSLNIYDLLYHEKLVLSQAAVSELEELLGAKSENGENVEEDSSEKDAEPAAEDVKVEKIAKPKRTSKPAEPKRERKTERPARKKKEAA